jgi:hypothetical protein
MSDLCDSHVTEFERPSTWYPVVQLPNATGTMDGRFHLTSLWMMSYHRFMFKNTDDDGVSFFSNKPQILSALVNDACSPILS